MTTHVVLQINKEGYKHTYIASDTMVTHVTKEGKVVDRTDTDIKTTQIESNGNVYIVSVAGDGKYATLLTQYDYSRLNSLPIKEIPQVMMVDLMSMYEKQYNVKPINRISIIFSKNGETLEFTQSDINSKLYDVVLDNKVKIFGSGSVVHSNSTANSKLEVYESEFFENGDFSNEAVTKFLKKIITLASQYDSGTSNTAIIHNTPYIPEEKVYQVMSDASIERGSIKGIAATNMMMKKNNIQTYIGRTALLNMAQKINKMAKTSTPVPITAYHGGFAGQEEVRTPHKFSIGSYTNAYVAEDSVKKVSVFNSETGTYMEEPYHYLTVDGNLDLSKKEAFDFYTQYQNDKKTFGFSAALKITRQEKAYDTDGTELMTVIKNVDLSAITLTYHPTDINAKVIAVASNTPIVPIDDDLNLSLEIEGDEQDVVLDLKTQLDRKEKDNTLLLEKVELYEQECGKYAQAFDTLLKKIKNI